MPLANQQCGQQYGQQGRDGPFPFVNSHPGRTVGRSPVGKDENADHQTKEGHHDGHGLVGVSRLETTGGNLTPGHLLTAIDQMHDGADHDRKTDCTERASHTELRPQHLGRDHDCHDVDSRSRVQECDRCAQTGAPLVDAAEQRQHRAGADRQQRTRNGAHTQCDRLGSLWSEVAQYRALADKDGHGARDDESGQQAENDMLPRVPMRQVDRLEHGSVKTARAGRNEVVDQEGRDFIARLAALVPRPRVNLTRFHGVFAPNSRYRARITPAGRGCRRQAVSRQPEPRQAMTWAQRLKRVFRIDIDKSAGQPICTVADCREAVEHKDVPDETCEHCGGTMRIIASIRLHGCRR